MAKDLLSREDIIDLLENVLGTEVVGSSKSKRDIMFSCMIHGESTPSSGISVEKNVFNCLSCHASGGVSWLLYKSLPDEYKSLNQAEKYLESKYGVSYEAEIKDYTSGIKRYDDIINTVLEEKERFELPKFKIAPFKSGKETYQYFFDRGFTKETMVDFMIGRDTTSKTVTIPIFWEDKKLGGVVGRYIDPNRPSNQRYKLYEFPKGHILFPLDKFEPTKDHTVILVEGLLDALWLHQLNYKNSLSILGNGLSVYQAEIVKKKAKNVIFMFDDDDGGRRAVEIAKKNLGKDINYFTTEYPTGRYDPQELTKSEIQYMLDNKRSIFAPLIKRL